MHEIMRRYMKVGIIHFMAYPETIKGEGPIVETLTRLAADDYFDVVEITWIKDAGTRARAKALLDTAHMTVAFGGQPMLLTTGSNINDTDDPARRKAVELLRESAGQPSGDPEQSTFLPCVYHALGTLNRHSDRPEDAVSDYRRAVAAQSDLVGRFPDNASYRVVLAWL